MGNQQIKVIHLDSARTWRGGQQQAIYLFSAMVERGFRTLFICPPQSATYQYCSKQNLPVKAIKIAGELDFLAGYRIAAVAREGKYDVIHAHSAHALAIALWCKLFYRSILVVGSRRVDFNIRKNPFSRFKYSSKWVKKIMCVSSCIEKVMLANGISPHKLLTIHSGIDLHKFDNVHPLADFRQIYGIPQDNIVVGTIAALVGHKDYPNLLKAARYVVSRNKKITFVAVGAGHAEQQIKKLHDQLTLGNSFTFTGHQRNVGAYLRNFDIFVLASQKEGLGSTLLEAQAVGLPVIGTRAGGIPEVIEPGINGLLVPTRDHRKLGEAILQLINDTDLREKLARNALVAVKKFAINNTVNKNIAVYEELVK